MQFANGLQRPSYTSATCGTCAAAPLPARALYALRCGLTRRRLRTGNALSRVLAATPRRGKRGNENTPLPVPQRGKRGAREGVPKFSLDKSPRACYTKRKATGDDLHRLAHSYFLSVLNITRKRAECQTFCSFFAHLWRFSFKNTIFYEHLFYFLADS